MEKSENSELQALKRSKTEGAIKVSGNGISGFSSAGKAEVYPDTIPRLLQRAKTNLDNTPTRTSESEFDVDKVLYEISRKVNGNKNEILYLFRNNDSSGRGAISREALHRIIRVLYGYLTADQFNNILRRLNIANRSQISYEIFMACFEDSEPMQKRYLRKNLMEPFWRATASPQEGDVDIFKKDERKYIDIAIGAERSKSADDHLAHIKKLVYNVFPSIRDHFRSDRTNETLLTSKSIRKVMENSGISPSPEDANALWERLDRAKCGLVPLQRFYTFIDPLNETLKKDEEVAKFQNNKRDEAFPPPTKSQLIPRLALENKISGRSRRLNAYKYPPDPNKTISESQPEEMLLQKAPTIHKHAFPTYLSRSVPVLPKRKPLILESNKSVLAQIAKRLTEPREIFMSFCKRFDEDVEKSSGKIALGYLLGCLLFCGKVVAEPMVTTLLQKLGIKAYFENEEVGKKYDYKTLGCAIFDVETNRLLAGVLQNPEHYFRAIKSDVISDWCAGEPNSYDSLEAKFMKFMYNDLITLVAELRRLDRNNSGIIAEKEFEVALSKVFNASFSKKQMAELTRGSLDSNGSVLIGEFVKNVFTTTQPEACRISTGNRQASVSKEGSPTDQSSEKKSADKEISQTGQEKEAKSEAYAAGSFGIQTEMNEEEAVELFKNIMRDRFHSFDKHFMALDVKQTKRISQVQVHHILRNLNIHINMRELGYMWKFVPSDADGLCSYRRFLIHFMTNVPDHPLNTSSSKKPTSAPTGDSHPTKQPKKEEPPKTATPDRRLAHTCEIDEVFECIRGDVCKNWSVLKERIRQEDAAGSGSFDSERLGLILKGSSVDYSAEALAYIKRKHTQILKNQRRFFYMPFMKYFTRRFTEEIGKCNCPCSNNFK